MGVKWHRDPATDCLVFSGRVSAADLIRLQLRPLDRATITAPIHSAADLFQSLEIIARNMEQGE